MNVFDPTKGMNAFAQGAQIGGSIRQAQTNSKLAPMVAQGDYKGAAAYAGQRGDLPSAELYQSQYSDQLAQMGEAEKKAAAERAQQLGKLAYGVRNLPYEQRQAAIANSLPVLQYMGMDPQSIQGFDPTDESLDTILAQVTDLSKMLEPKVVADGGQVWQGNRMIGENPKDAPPPKYATTTTADGVVAYNTADPTKTQNLGPAPVKSPLVQNTMNAGGAADNRPIVDKPAKDMAYVWDGEKYVAEPIAGTETARDRETYAIKSAAAQRADDEQYTTMTRNIDKAIDQADFWSAGLMAQVTSGIGSTPARNLKATMDTIVANIGFDKLNEMRQTSPTGGALGQVTERELAFLQSVRGSMDQIQDPAQLRETLKDVKESLGRLYEARRIAAQLNMTNSGTRVPSGDLNQDPDMNDLLQYMTPEERALFESAQ